MNLNILDNKIDLDFDSDDELLSAILLSVFTDAKADDELVSSVEVQSEWGNEDLLLQINIDGKQFNLKYEL